jgi:hypothetical protein
MGDTGVFIIKRNDVTRALRADRMSATAMPNKI